MPVIDFHDRDEYGAAIEFLVRRGITFHTRPPLRLMLASVDYQALDEAKILRSSEAKATSSRAKKTRSSAKPKTRRAS
ncbi:MAG: hypothetical protein ACREHD_19790 [Pirellulales bacterium]